MLTLTQSTIQGYTLRPTGHVSLWDASFQHPFEVHYQVESHAINEAGIGYNHIFIHCIIGSWSSHP
jgi:hypothetical protein